VHRIDHLRCRLTTSESLTAYRATLSILLYIQHNCAETYCRLPDLHIFCLKTSTLCRCQVSQQCVGFITLLMWQQHAIACDCCCDLLVLVVNDTTQCTAYVILVNISVIRLASGWHFVGQWQRRLLRRSCPRTTTVWLYPLCGTHLLRLLGYLHTYPAQCLRLFSANVSLAALQYLSSLKLYFSVISRTPLYPIPVTGGFSTTTWNITALWLFVPFLSFLPAQRYASAGLCDSDVSVCLSVCHTPVLWLAERKQDREMYTVW